MVSWRDSRSDRSPVARQRNVKLWPICLLRNACQDFLAEPCFPARLKSLLEISAIPLGFHLPKSQGALRIKSVRTDEAQIVEEDPVQLHANQRSRGLLHWPHQTDIDRQSKIL